MPRRKICGAFFIKIPNKNGLHEGSPQFREENCGSLVMGTLGSILVDVCSK
jgi:hypothetical protein